MEIFLYCTLILTILCYSFENTLCCTFNGSDDLWKIKDNSFYTKNYDYFSETERLAMKDKVKEMFYFGYDNYLQHAFPLDELNPIDCCGRGPDKEKPDNININDVLGDYSLTLIDALDTLAIMGNQTEFQRAVKLVIDHVDFNKDNTVQVFEVTIRVLGGLLAAHLLMTDPTHMFGVLKPKDYDNELLLLAHDLANRLLPAFDSSNTGIPWPRVNLRNGLPENCASTTCTAGVGTLVVEFGMLSYLLQDESFENIARRAVDSLWKYRSNETGLFGNEIDINNGVWVGTMSGLGAGIDSFYEYLIKSYILFGEKEDLHRFNDLYECIMKHMRRGRTQCNNGTGDATLYVNVDMKTGHTVNTWIDSLQASFTGVQVLRGDIEEAVCSHALYFKIWQRYGALPERFNWNLKAPDVKFYPLRPEFSEATYMLYQATKHPFYLHVGMEIINSLETNAKAKCGYATIHDVEEKSLEDRMESFFLSETLKYLYLLFDFENPLNHDAANWIFSTEGHVFKLNEKYRAQVWRDKVNSLKRMTPGDSFKRVPTNSTLDWKCNSFKKQRYSKLPLKDEYFEQIEKFVGMT